MWRASENPWTSFNMIQRKAPFVYLLIPGTLNKKTPLLRCSCLIGWNKWSILMMSSISIAFWVMTCSVSKGACTTNLPPKYSFKSPITKRNCDNDHHKKCKTQAKDSTLPRWLLNLFFLWASLRKHFHCKPWCREICWNSWWGKMTWSQVSVRRFHKPTVQSAQCTK